VIKTVKTYLWIKATAVSKIINIIKTKENKLKIIILFLQRAIKICPAVIFAASRTERVIGRIIWLTVSIITINWDKARGVLKGTKCLKKWFIFLWNLKTIKHNQKGKANLNVNIIWAVIVKV